MNIEEYISSGILESYVLDELPPEERREVESMSEKHPEIKRELEKIELSIEKLAFSTAISPDAAIKEAVLKAVDNKQPPMQITHDKRESGWLKYAVAASVTIALVTSYLAFDYYGKWRNTESELSTLIAQNQQVAQDYNVVNQRLDQIENDLKVINNPAYQRVTLNATENAAGALAHVYWNKTSEEVYLSIQNLKELSESQQYQLWAIIDGKPVDAGVFDLENGLLKMKNIAGAAAFAVTIEPKGGSINPSLETMQVVGNV
ncbi:MAG: anti-sigma factor [Fulvivirga sp.]|uniref:anti-sigma factor n=1 Tax=Fulvivirga sp. TaxID=1931237 RepID=UPI0032EEDA3D